MHIKLCKQTEDIELADSRDAVEYTWTNGEGSACKAYSPPTVAEGIEVTPRELNAEEAAALMARLKARKEKIHGVAFTGVVE